MKYLPILLLMTTPVWADLQRVEPTTQERYDTGNIYGITESTRLPEVIKHTTNATANLSNLNGSLMTITGGNANITGAVNAANQVNNTFGSGLMQVLKTEGAVRSVPDDIDGMFRTR